MHGGDIYSAGEVIGKNPYEIIDMSVSVNPLPIPEKIKKKVIDKFELLHKYPDTEVRRFRKLLTEILNIPSSTIICGNGSTELIYLTVFSLKPSSVLILEPTFIEYYRACRIYEVPNVKRIFSLNKAEILNLTNETLKSSHYDMVFICNPNNPTGWITEKESLLQMIKRFENTFFIIDEAFIDFVPDESIVKESILLKNTIVLRCLTKFYGLAGLRFGYAVGNSEVIEKLKKFQQPWSVNLIAQWIAEEIIKDKEFKTKTFNFFKEEKKFFESLLNSLSIEYFPSVANFYLIKTPRKGFFRYMVKKGILVRNCSNFYGLNDEFIRISVKTRQENKIFFNEFEEFLRALK